MSSANESNDQTTKGSQPLPNRAGALFRINLENSEDAAEYCRLYLAHKTNSFIFRLSTCHPQDERLPLILETSSA